MNDTIFALSSGHGKSGVAVIRISGDNLCEFFQGIILKKIHTNIISRHAYLIDFSDAGGNLVDKCIAIYFNAPYSFTGQDVIELHCHGAPIVISKIFDVLENFGLRIAECGEFSRRAFENNKLDLVEADGLAALLDSRTDKQRANALKIMSGGDSGVFENWRAQMIDIAAYAAAIMDYPSDDLPDKIDEILVTRTKKLNDEISISLLKSGAARKIQSGFNVVLIGETNVGKSSLFNRLVGESRAIVSDIHGTTRDVITSELDIDGYLVRLSDTAGLRESTDEIENIGMYKTRNEISNADLILRVIDKPINSINNDNELLVINKCDLFPDFSESEFIYVSAQTGFGIDKLLDIIKQKIGQLTIGAESDVVINARVKSCLENANFELENALYNKNNFDIFAQHINFAANYIGEILGTIGTQEILDSVFGQLCLGK